MILQCRLPIFLTLLMTVAGSIARAEQQFNDQLALQTGDTPTLRLQQTNANGHTPQMWDLSGNDLGFFINDVTAGTTPVSIKSLTSQRLFVDFGGSVLWGAPPDNDFSSKRALYVYAIKDPQASTFGTMARYQIADDAVSRLEFNTVRRNNSNFTSRLQGQSVPQVAALIMEGIVTLDSVNSNSPALAFNASGKGGSLVNRPLVEFRNNAVTKARITAAGDVLATSFNAVSSRSRKRNITDLEYQVAIDALQKLTPVQFVYKSDSAAEPRLGFIAEDVPDLVANPSRDSVSIMDTFAVVTRVIKEHQGVIEDQTATINRQVQQIEAQERSLREKQRELQELQSELRDASASINDRQQAIQELIDRLERVERRMPRKR